MPGTVYISFSAEISTQTAEHLIGVMANLAKRDVSEVHLLLSTGGGNVMEGMNIYNVLCGMPFTLVTHNVGNVDSVGNVIFLAGKKRYACPTATFMFHGVAWNIPTPTRLEQKNVEEILDGILSSQKRMGDVIKLCTSLSLADVDDLFRQAKTKSADEALRVGIIQEIRDVQIPGGAEVIPLVFQR